MAALAVVLVISLATGETTSGHGCVSVSLAYSTGGDQITRCGVGRQVPVPGRRPAGGITGVPAQTRGRRLPQGRAARRLNGVPLPKMAAAMTDPAAFRAQFPVLERVSYLNAGTEGPLPRRAAEAVRERIESELTGGRAGKAYMDTVRELAGDLRAGYARVLGADPADVALTGSTTDGVNTVLSGLSLRPGDEIVTSDEEHPGLLAPLGRLKRLAGVTVKVAPFAELAEAVTSATRLVACSHVSWVSGQVVDSAALAATGVPVLLDAAQGIGAVPVDVHALGCAFYAGSGQKWLCGPEGSGCLYVSRDQLDELTVPWPGYGSLADASHALDSGPAENAGRFDHGFPPGLRSAWALASLGVFEDAGWEWVHDRAAELAAGLAGQPGRAGPGGGPARALDARRLEAARRGPRCRGGAAGRGRLRGAQHPLARAHPRLGGGLVLGGGAGRAGGRRRRGYDLASGDPLRLRVDVDRARGGQTRTGSGRGRRPARSPASSGRRPRSGSARRPPPPSARARRRAGRSRTAPGRSSGSRPSSSARPTTLSMALWRPTSSRV